MLYVVGLIFPPRGSESSKMQNSRHCFIAFSTFSPPELWWYETKRERERMGKSSGIKVNKCLGRIKPFLSRSLSGSKKTLCESKVVKFV